MERYRFSSIGDMDRISPKNAGLLSIRMVGGDL